MFIRAFFSLVRKMPGYKLAKTGHGPHFIIFFPHLIFIVMYVPFSAFCVLFVCKCALYYCHRVSTKCALYYCHRVSTHLQLKINDNKNILRFIAPFEEPAVRLFVLNDWVTQIYKQFTAFKCFVLLIQEGEEDDDCEYEKRQLFRIV
jgi:hypothetical protein